MGRRSRAKRAAAQARVDSVDGSGGALRLDGWENLTTGLGTSRDKRTHTSIAPSPRFSIADLEELFHGNDLANRIVTLPAVEMFRQGIEIKIDEGDDKAEDGSDERAATIADVMQYLQTLGAMTHLTEGKIWARLHGNGYVYMGADMGPSDDPELPLDLTRVQSLRFLHVYDTAELRLVEIETDKASSEYGKPRMYQVQTVVDTTTEQASARVNAPNFGQKIHASRVLSFVGARTSRRRRRQQGWRSDSVFVRMFEVLRGYGVTWASAEALLQDFAQTVYKMKGLGEAMATNNEDLVKERLAVMDLSRSVMRMVMIDADNEDIERKPTPITGLPEMLDRWLQRVSAACGIPITLLFGMSPGGLNATGDNDVRNFYDAIKVEQENEIRPQLEKLLKIVFAAKDGPTGGVEPKGWSFTFCPLWQMSDKEKADLRKAVAETDQIYLVNQVVSPAEVSASRFGGDSYSLETTLDRETRDVMSEALAAAPVPAEGASAEGVATPPGASVPGAPAVPAAGAPAPQGAPGVDVQKQALNGAQVSSALEIIKAVASGEIPPTSAQALLELAFQLDPADATRMLPPPDFKPPEPPPPAPGPGSGGFGDKSTPKAEPGA